jgi:two-component system LytT family response regulator
MIKAVVIDDEMKARDILKKLVSRYCPKIEIIGEANSIESGFDLITKLKPSLVFLDIHLDTQNSFDLLSKFPAIPFDIIFTSGHSEFGVPAFKVNAIDYLLKPIDSDDLVIAVEKVIKKHNLEGALNQDEDDKLIPIHNNDVVQYLNSSTICSLEAENNYSQIFTLEEKKYMASKTLGDMEDLLKDTNHFIRIHRSIIINTKFITSYSKSEPFCVTLANGKTYEISRRKKSEVLAFLKNKE